MAKKKRKPQKPLHVRFVRRASKWVRPLGITAGLIAVLAAVIYLTDPFGGAPTAIDADGNEVRAGIIEGAPDAEARPGRPAPNFVLPDFDERAVQLDAFRDKAVFVNFWASWCGPCANEMPEIVRIAEQFPDDVVVIAINRGESKGTATDWSEHFNENLPNFHWVLDEREDVVAEYRVNGMPQSFFLDGGGVIRGEVRQEATYEVMLSNVQQALNFTRPPGVAN
ncbi:MAG: TlpA disulfide reductase family protein [Dehalococcoidia bacterium]